ncbi:MAG: hypothetical protein CFH41_01151 [Alphaproteobacteria bacterium MarineAlpha11_Bin1]|nr:MAG: hypothetical protein CFH41_01151 [Alphaproteobacteria bacterium MarineAlpha11_Bin1]|tara:strand:- start:15647 stop:16195 length:549 start_codon:yes stop_codon:yes gene_type:complete
MLFTSDHGAWNRRRLGLAIYGAATLLLSGCSFQPIHGDRSAASGRALANFEIAKIADRTGQMMRNELLQQLQPRGRARTPRFKLSVYLTESRSNLAIRKDDVATRANLTLAASYAVANRSDGTQLLSGQTRSVNSYNILTSDFATLSAQADARNRAIRQLARNIKERLAVWLVQTGGHPGTR